MLFVLTGELGEVATSTTFGLHHVCGAAASVGCEWHEGAAKSMAQITQ